MSAVSLFVMGTIGIWIIVNVVVSKLRRLYRTAKGADNGLRLASATIARDLVPLVRKHLNPSSKIYLTGGDGEPISKKSYRWYSDLQQWLRLGCEIYYLLIEPSDAAILQLEKLAKQFPGKLEVVTIPKIDNIQSENARIFAKSLRTFHPTLFELGDGNKAIWLERFHPSRSTIAYDCEFFPPKSKNIEEKYAKLFEDIMAIKQIGAVSAI